MSGDRFEALSFLFERPTESLRYRAYCWAFAVGSAVHLTLPDALQWSWLAPNILYWSGILLVAIRGARLGWFLSALGLLVPLLFLSDQLTQSAFLFVCSLAVLFALKAPRADLEVRLGEQLPRTIGYLTVLTYFIAAVHKLNRDFFDPQVSCANGGLEILLGNWNLTFLQPLASSPLWPVLFIVTEALLVVLFVWRVKAALLLGLLLHIPLTIIFAPAFAFTMISGWVCLLNEAQLRFMISRFKQHWGFILSLGFALGLLSFVLYLQRHWVVYAYWSFKEAVLWVLVVWVLFSWRGFPDRIKSSISLPTFAWVCLGLWLVNGLLPYTGLKFHHSGAMLSNLRVDRGCWNSLWVPDAVRFVDPDAAPPWWAQGIATQQSNRAAECPQACIH